MSGGTDNGGDDRTLAQFFFEVGYGACWAEAFVRSGGVRPFPITDDGIERAWEVAREGHDDLADFDRKKALSEAAPEMAEALQKAKQFIENGIEMGFIRMPDPETPDSAHDTLPLIRTLLTKIGATQ